MGTSRILAWGKSCVRLPPPFIAINTRRCNSFISVGDQSAVDLFVLVFRASRTGHDSICAFRIPSSLIAGVIKLETELARRTACRAQVKELKSEKLSPCSSGNLKGFKCLRAVRLARSVSNLTSPCNERTWNAKGTDTIMTSPEREPPKTSTRDQQRFDRRQELHLWVFIPYL